MEEMRDFFGDPEICDYGERRSKPSNDDFSFRKIKLRGFATTKACHRSALPPQPQKVEDESAFLKSTKSMQEINARLWTFWE